jgi:hypothetical protein
MEKLEIATDSASELHTLIGDDATATFELDPKFIDANPTANASTENVTVQSDEDEDEELEDDDEDDIDEEDEDDEDEDDDMDTDQVADPGVS